MTTPNEEDQVPHAPIVRLVQLYLSEARGLGASKAEFWYENDVGNVRFAVGDKWLARDGMPGRIYNPVVTRFKVISKLDIAERGQRQETVMPCQFTTEKVDIRIVITPDGERERIDLFFPPKMPKPVEEYPDLECQPDFMAGLISLMSGLSDSDKVLLVETALMNLPVDCFRPLLKTLDTDIVNELFDSMVDEGRMPRARRYC